ncbi:NAD-dependent deacylase [bacterium]|nr:NAD-dependent deacylase [bacterium]
MAEFEPIRVKDYPMIAVLTGAGISVASGIAPFRGPGGTWTEKDIEECATARALKKNPQKVWDAFSFVREKSNKVDPNPAHKALAELEAKHPNTYIITQNIDGLHQKAGSRNVLEMHGSIHRSQCTKYCSDPFDDTKKEFWKCPKCGAPLRYDIVLFEESLDYNVMRKIDEILNELDLFMVVGTSNLVYPAAGFVDLVSRYNSKARIVIVNLEKLHFTDPRCEQINGKAEEILPKLFKYD